MTRILSQHGNVIAAEFRPRAELTVQIKSDWVFLDDHAGMLRITLLFDGKPTGKPSYLAIDFNSGTIATL